MTFKELEALKEKTDIRIRAMSAGYKALSFKPDQLQEFINLAEMIDGEWDRLYTAFYDFKQEHLSNVVNIRGE